MQWAGRVEGDVHERPELTVALPGAPHCRSPAAGAIAHTARGAGSRPPAGADPHQRDSAPACSTCCRLIPRRRARSAGDARRAGA